MAMKRMMRMNILNSGRGKRDEGRAKEYGRGGGEMNEGRYGQGYGRGGMERGGWQDSGWEGKDTEGRYKGERERMGKRYEGYDDDEYEGGGRYAGNFRHREDPGEYEASKEVKFDEHKAKEWVGQMKNSDGTTGEHFKAEQAEQMRIAHCPNCDKHEFWAAMNMMYSDYCEVAKKMNIDRPDFYAHMAKAFLMDKDAGHGKLAKYMKYVAGK